MREIKNSTFFFFMQEARALYIIKEVSQGNVQILANINKIVYCVETSLKCFYINRSKQIITSKQIKNDGSLLQKKIIPKRMVIFMWMNNRLSCENYSLRLKRKD